MQASDVSKLVKERDGYDLLPEMDYKPVNKYLPPRARRDEARATTSVALKPEAVTGTEGTAADRLFAWLDNKLSA